MYNYLIVGSGPAGVSAAKVLSGKNVCIVDVGELNEYNLEVSGVTDRIEQMPIADLLGRDFEMLSNVVNPLAVHPKARHPNLKFALNGSSFTVYNEKMEPKTHINGSFARGGMSNIWGGQLLRYTQNDLESAGNWPIKFTELEPYYTSIEREVKISGEVDDLTDFLGHPELSCAPIRQNETTKFLLDAYKKNKQFFHKLGFKLGTPKLAINTSLGYEYNRTDFFKSNQNEFYNAQKTLDILISKGQKYIPDTEVLFYKEFKNHIEVKVRNTKSGLESIIKTKVLLIAAGTLQSTKIVLNSNDSDDIKLNFIDHIPSLIPIFIPRMFGGGNTQVTYPLQLIASHQSPSSDFFMSFYNPSGALWSDFLADVPFTFKNSPTFLSYIMSGFMIAQIWQKSTPNPNIFLSYKDKNISLHYKEENSLSNLPDLLKCFRKLGAYSKEKLLTNFPLGWGFHYAGTLPMSKAPSAFSTDRYGKLWNSNRVYIVDGSILPSLPAKNHSLTIMANASRISSHLCKLEY